MQMKKLIYGPLYLSAALACIAAPPTQDQLELRTSMNLAADMGVGASSMFNPRIFDGNVYVNQVNVPAFGIYPLNSAVPSTIVYSTSEHRMVAPFRGDNQALYLFGASGAATTVFSRYDANGENRVDVDVPGEGQTSEGFDWVDQDTIIYTTYNPSANRKRLSLATVTAEPFAVTPDTTWNANGYITTSVSTRIRNVRVGDVYSGFAYYGDSGQNASPNFYAINLATGAETLLGNAGTLTGSGSFGIWTVVERGGYLYVQTTDNGIQVYNMTSATNLGGLYTTYSKERLDELTGATGQYYGLDVSPDGKQLVLGGNQGVVYQLALIPPLRLTTTFNLAGDLGVEGSSIFNTRIFDGDVYVNQVNIPAFGRYPLGSAIPEVLVPSTTEHRMVAPFRGENQEDYMIAGSGAATTFFSRYEFTGENRVDADVPGSETAEGFDWVDPNTIVYTTYSPSANRKRISLAHVTAEPFSLAPDTRWNGNGYITTSASTRIRNVRVGDVYNGYAYYGDNGQNNSPNFYALNLATGAETLLGNAGQLTGTGSFGLWTVVERGGKLYVQTTDNGIQVYKLNSATSLGALERQYTKQQIDEATGYTGHYWGFDVTPDGKTFVLGGAPGTAWELAVTAEEPLSLSISRSGADVVLAWPAAINGAIVEAADALAPGGFSEMNPQPTVQVNAGQNNATLPAQGKMRFFRLKK